MCTTPLDGVWEQTEKHGLNATPKTKTTKFSYIGSTPPVAGEEITGDAQSSSKTYSYDVVTAAIRNAAAADARHTEDEIRVELELAVAMVAPALSDQAEA